MLRNTQDDDNLREALRYSAAMLGELRTSLLTPQKYFELYMQAFDELRHLEARPSQPPCLQRVQARCTINQTSAGRAPVLKQRWGAGQAYFAEEHNKGRSYADLYELVQHAGNVLPRLCAPTRARRQPVLVSSPAACGLAGPAAPRSPSRHNSQVD